ncbi:MAG TPA: efflux RND transporter permease subunit [Methylomusa anaerophila]|uniref:Multidrug resistance protein MdtB n=1 Tax=Methylomusa anaerophila TaxID=1930071 RepID=A0A348AHZ5_9FIRM|nr:efflux RND transporter permease subunit [Methylomusa anaerophila]BBB90693.1 multidrug resistance protein MdtB [Methylomusa anaerophila]HML88704.1 efflux RND transporter permease subunit [Methylomusa anaerophila]
MILADISLKRPVFATVTILALITLGFVSYLSLNIDEWPNVEFPFVTVQVVYTGAGPEQVDSKITQRVEEAVGSCSGVKHITSVAREGVSTTTVEFSLETNPATATQDVRDKIGRIRGDLPQDAEEPIIMRFDPTEEPVVSVAITGNQSIRELTKLNEDVIKRRLETISGVGSIDIQGGLKREIHIDLDKDKIAAYGLSISEIANSLKQENLEVPGGKLTKGEREVTMRTMGNMPSAQEFLKAPLARRDGVQIYVDNVANVGDVTEEAESVAKFNGKPAIGLDIIKQSGSNTVQVAENVKQVVAQLRQEMPPGVELTVVRDNSKYIRESIGDLVSNLIICSLLAIAIVFVFLADWRSTMIAAIAIPASIISTFFTMKLLGYSLNTMSLMALSLAIGLLIDDAIVVVENIVRHMEMGKNKFQAAAEGTAEIGLAVTATTFTLVAVFVPVGMMTGIVGQFFKQFGITVAFSVLVSLFIAFTLTPMLSANYLDVAHRQKQNLLGRMLAWWNQRFDRLTESYGGLLKIALRHRLKLLALALIMFVGSLALTPLLGSTFISRTDNGEFTVAVDVEPGTSVAGAAALADRMAEIIKETPEVVLTYGTASVETISLFVKIKDKNDRQRSMTAITADLREKLNAIPNVKVSILQRSGVGEEKPVQIVAGGDDINVLNEMAEQAQRIMENTPGAVDVVSTFKPGKPDIQVTVDRERAADLGVSTGNIADTLSTMFNGLTVSRFKDGDDQYDVKIRLQEGDRRGMDDLSGIYLNSQYKDSQGKSVLVPLSQVTEPVFGTTPSQINRYDRQKEIRLTANLEGTSLGEFNNSFFNEIKKINIPPGYKLGAVGESERMGETFTSMVMALFLSVAFIFFVLAAQFESYIDPFAIMLSLPLAIIGAILGLLVMRSDLSIMSMIGIVMLMGLVTKNAILLIDFAKQRRAQGVERDTALVEAAVIRMRPIMMTTAAMIFGMLPLATGFGPGAEIRAPMAHAIIGGLVTSTILTLVIVPVVYSLMDDLKGVWQRFNFKLKKTTTA